MSLTQEDYRRLVEEAYFGTVMTGNVDAVLEAFTDDAEVTIYHGDNPVRRFKKTPGEGEVDLREFYAHLCGHFNAGFDGFMHVADLERARAAAMFTVTLTPRPDSPHAGEDALVLNNCNFFKYRGDKISWMVIYYSNSTLGAKLGQGSQGLTGFPKDE